MTTGLILLVFIALLVAFGWARLRHRLGLTTSGRAWVTVMVIVVLGVLAMWASSTHG
jgi:fumarate reductase subunit D